MSSVTVHYAEPWLLETLSEWQSPFYMGIAQPVGWHILLVLPLPIYNIHHSNRNILFVLLVCNNCYSRNNSFSVLGIYLEKDNYKNNYNDLLLPLLAGLEWWAISFTDLNLCLLWKVMILIILLLIMEQFLLLLLGRPAGLPILFFYSSFGSLDANSLSCATLAGKSLKQNIVPDESTDGGSLR